MRGKSSCRKHNIHSRLTNTEIEKRNQTTNLLKQEVYRAASKIADLTAKTLILEDENSKLINTNKKLNTDIKQIQTKMNDKSSATENSENILSVVTDMAEELGKITTNISEVKNKVSNNSSEADILLLKVDMKNTLNQQINGLKTSITTGMCPNQPIVVDDQTPQQTTLPNATEIAATNTSKRTDSVSTSSHDTKKPKHIYILGDTVTNVLSTKKLSGDKYSVSIKTTQGARIAQIKSIVQTLSTKDTRLTTCDAVLLHTGIHNISDAQSTGAITEQYKDLISTVKNVNKKAHIILSSVLPKKEDQLSAKSIKDVNQQIKELCQHHNQVHFMNNTPQFINNNIVNQNLYRNDLELSSQGAARLAKNIMSAINTCLKTGYNTRPNSSAGNFHQSSLQKTTGQHQEWRGGRPMRPQQRPDPRRTWPPPRQSSAPWTRSPPNHSAAPLAWTPSSQRAPPHTWTPPNQRAAPPAWAPHWMPRWAPPPPPGFY